MREFPETREEGTQTVEERDEAGAREFPGTRETETQTVEVKQKAEGLQMTPEVWMLLAELQAEAERRGRGEATKQPLKEEPRAEGSGKQRRNVSPRGEARRTGPIRKRCWNCGSSKHKYTECVRS